jgi:5-methylcytosine-specific restriction endonuclease McrA
MAQSRRFPTYRIHHQKDSIMRTRKTPKLPRKRAWLRQNGRCYYCQFPIWLAETQHLFPSPGLTPAQSRLLQCTAEHLTPWSEGGADSETNIVAACRHCNRLRHCRKRALSPEAFRERVRSRLASGSWHLQAVLESLAHKCVGLTPTPEARSDSPSSRRE